MATSRSDAESAGTVFPQRRPFARLLIANRGEIAVRIIRACQELDIETVAVYSDADATALHVRLASQAIRIGPAPATESYLRADAIIEAALATGAEAIHPGLRIPVRARVVRRGGRGGRVDVRRARPSDRSPRSATSWPRAGRRPRRASRSSPGRSSRRRSSGPTSSTPSSQRPGRLATRCSSRPPRAEEAAGCAESPRPPSCPPRWPPAPTRRPRRSATVPSTSSGRSGRPATSKSSSSATPRVA